MPLLEVRQMTEVPFLFATVILEFLSIFKKSQVSSPFEALNTACFSRCQMDVTPHLQMRLGPTVFCRVSTVDSDNRSCDMKDVQAFMPLQETPACFQFRVSRYPLHLRQQTQGPSQIPIAEGTLLWRCLWKVVLPFQSKPVKQLSSGDDIGCMDLFSSCCIEIGDPLDLRRVSQGISAVSLRKSSHLLCMM